MKRVAQVGIGFLAGLVVATAITQWLGPMLIGWKSYVPRIQSDDAIVRSPAMLDNKFGLATAIVLVRYGEPFIYYTDGYNPPRIYVRRSLEADEELVWNFTTKAEGISAKGTFLDRYLRFLYDERTEGVQEK